MNGVPSAATPSTRDRDRALKARLGGSISSDASASASQTRDPRRAELRRILHLLVPVSVILAERTMSVRSILEVTAGSIIEFDVPCDTRLTLAVGNRPIGRGQAVKIGEKFGLRVTGIDGVQARIDAMGR